MSVHNVMSYGAAGNGSADDRAAFQAALDAVEAWDTVYIPPGNYRLTEMAGQGCALRLPPIPFRMMGHAATTTVLFLDTQAPPATKMLEIEDGSPFLEIAYFTLDGTGAAKTYDAEGDLIHAGDARHLGLHDLVFMDAVSEGIDLDHVEDADFYRIVGEDLGGNLLHVGGSATSKRVSARFMTAINCSHRRAQAGKANPFAFHVSGDAHNLQTLRALQCANGIGSSAGKQTIIEVCFVNGGIEAFKGIGATIRCCTAQNATSTGFASPRALYQSVVLGNGVTSNGVKFTTPDGVADGNFVLNTKYTGIMGSSPAADNLLLYRNDLRVEAGGYSIHLVDGIIGAHIDLNNLNGRPMEIPEGNFVGEGNVA